MAHEIEPSHPGEVLTEFLAPTGLSGFALAKAIGVPRGRINEICRGECRIDAALALWLWRHFDVDCRWFMNMQTHYDLGIQAERLTDKLAAIAPRRPA